MKVVDVLRNNRNTKVFFQLSQNEVSVVGLNIVQLQSTLVVEIGYKFRVALPSFWGCNVFNAVLLPQSVGIAKGVNTAFGAGSSAR